MSKPPEHGKNDNLMKGKICQLFLLGLPLLAFADEQPTFWASFGGSDEHAHNWIVYGHRTNKIAFVIFQTNHGTSTNDYSQHIHLTLHTPKNPLACEGWIDMPDGTKQDLPSSSMVFECTDGVFHSAPIDISYADFSRYLDSVRPKFIGAYKKLTVADLKKFEKKVKAKSSNKTPTSGSKSLGQLVSPLSSAYTNVVAAADRLVLDAGVKWGEPTEVRWQTEPFKRYLVFYATPQSDLAYADYHEVYVTTNGEVSFVLQE